MAEASLAEPAQSAHDIGFQASAALSSLEWEVIVLAEQDSLNSLQEPSGAWSAISSLFFKTQNKRLSNERLEALRRLAIHAWYYGYAVPEAEVRSFYRAGFNRDQLEQVVTWVANVRRKRNRSTRR